MSAQHILYHRGSRVRQLIKYKEKTLIKMPGIHAIKHVTNMVVRWNFFHTKQRLGIILSYILKQGTLEGQKRRMLHKEQRKCSNTYIRHRIAAIGPATLIGHQCARMTKIQQIFFQLLHSDI